MKEQKERRAQGSGSIYPRGKLLHISYYVNGVQKREPAHTDNWKIAQKLLNQRLGQVAADTYVEPSSRKVTIDQLYESLLTNYKINKKASYAGTEARWQRQPKEGEPMPEPGRLKKWFSGMLALALTTPRIEEYIKWCQDQKLENSTINRDIAALRRAFKLGVKAKVISHCPDFTELDENPPREGFVEYSDYEKLKAHAHELWLRAILACYFLGGMRKSEVVGNFRRGFVDGLKVKQIDLLNRQIRLGVTKNGDRRLVPMTQEVYTLVSACVSGKRLDDWVFTHEDGTQVMDFRKRFRSLKRRAGVRPDLKLHDNRRSMARNLRRAGVDRKTIKLIGGWKTDSVFERYDIHDESDLHDAARKYDAALKQAQSDHNSQELHQNRAPVDFPEADVKPSNSTQYN